MTTLLVEFFDTDQSSYKHRLAIPLKSPGSFSAKEPHTLRVEASDGTSRFVPLVSTKQYYETIDRHTAEAGADDQAEPDWKQPNTTEPILLDRETEPPKLTERFSHQAEPVASTPFPSLLIDELLRRVELAGFTIPSDIHAEPIGEKAGFLLEVLIEADIKPRDSLDLRSETSDSRVRVESAPNHPERQFTTNELELILNTLAVYLQDRGIRADVADATHPEYQKEKDLWVRVHDLLEFKTDSAASAEGTAQ